MRLRVIAIVLSTLASLVIPVVNAQDHLLPVEGVLVDETGAAIPHAKLVFKAESDALVAYTSINGVVSVMSAAGRYAVTISQFGFATTKLADFLVQSPNVDAFRVVLKVEPTDTDRGGMVPTAMGAQTVTSELPNVIADEHARESTKQRDCET